MNSNFVRLTFCLMAAVLVFGHGVANAETITIQHLGLTNPVSEGFTFYSGTQSGGTDTLDYWQITNSTSAAAQYKYPVGGWNDTAGWTATAVVKVVSGSPGGTSPSIGECAQVMAELLDASDRWDIHLIDGTGEKSMGMYVVDSAGLLLQLAGVDVMEYHTYQAVYNPAGGGGGGAVTYYLDGSAVSTLVRADIADATIDWAAFGSSAITADTGTTSRWNEFTLETGQNPVPEPAALAMLISGLAALAIFATRRK